MLFLWKFINNSKDCVYVFWFKQICDEIAEKVLSAFLKDFKRVQQVCESLLKNLNIFAYYAVEGVIINVMI